MKRLFLIIMSLTLCSIAFAIAPVVSNVTASQRTDGSKITDIYYDLFDAESNPCDIIFKVSANGGTTYDIIPSPANLSGDIGYDLSGGTNKHIVWNTGAESYTLNGSNYLYRVYAFDGSVPDNFALVAGGTFLIGTSNVTLSSFYMDKYEVTQANYQAVMGTNPALGYGVGANYPVYTVSWFNAIEYCNRRSINEMLTPCYSYSTYGTNPANWPSGWNTNNANHTNVTSSWTASGYRLPTEMEWQFAARGGNLTHSYVYSGSNIIGDVAWFSENSGSSTHTVGTKAANELGLFDMTGNVWEWNWDIYGSYPGGTQTNPHGPTSGADRVMRGGSWGNDSNACPVSFRYYYNATFTFSSIGFRVCRVSP